MINIPYNNDLRVNKLIRKIMIDRDMSMTQIGAKIGMTQQGVSRQLNNRNVNIDQMCGLADSVDCDVQINFIDRNTGNIMGSVTLDDKKEI